MQRRLVLCLMSGLLPASAPANCPPANRYSYEFGTAAPATLSYASSYTYAATSPALGNQNMTVSWPVVNGTTSTVVATFQMPRIDSIVNDGNPATANNLVVGMVLGGRTASITSGTRVVVTRFAFATPVRSFTIQVNDVDYNPNQFRDWLHISGSNGASLYAPAITTPVGSNNGALGPRTAAGSTINLGPATTPFSMTEREAIGNANAPNTDDTGTLTATFAQPVTQVELRYGNNGVSPGGTATTQQAFGIQRVSWCAMPTITVAKGSAPWSDPANGTVNPKLIPGADLLYTLTVSNSNASILDGADLPVITDLLPPGLTFLNGDIDDGGPLMTNFEFVANGSGLSLAPTGVSYSNNGGSTFAYTPSAGYDAQVNGLRFAPTGTFNANSSFQIRFRLRIN